MKEPQNNNLFNLAMQGQKAQSKDIVINNHAISFSIDKGQVFCTSLDIAKVFEKEHKNVLVSIRNTLENIDNEIGQLNFKPSYYINEQNKQQPLYNLTRDAFSLIVMSLTGEKALQWKIAFINAFNAMEKALRESQYKIPQTYAEALLEAGRLALENEKLIAEAKENAPKIEAFNALMDSKDAIDFLHFSKIIGIGRNTLFERLRDKGILMRNNIPYQRFIDSEYFRVIEGSYTQGDYTKSYTKTMILPKGQTWLVKILSENQ